jgi:hypothetical protein
MAARGWCKISEFGKRAEEPEKKTFKKASDVCAECNSGRRIQNLEA